MISLYIDSANALKAITFCVHFPRNKLS